MIRGRSILLWVFDLGVGIRLRVPIGGLGLFVLFCSVVWAYVQ